MEFDFDFTLQIAAHECGYLEILFQNRQTHDSQKMNLNLLTLILRCFHYQLEVFRVILFKRRVWHFSPLFSKMTFFCG